MSGLDQDENPERRKKTVWLLAGGAASLLLPLLGAVYLHLGGSGGANGPSGRNDVFERRDSGDKKLVPSTAAVPPSALAVPAASPLPSGPTGGKPAPAPTGSSLDFIKPGAEMAGKFSDGSKPAAAAAATAATAPPAPAATPAAAPAASPAAKAPSKKGKKDFVMPKLQPTRGFSSMGGSNSGGKAAPPPAGAGGVSPDMLKNLPPGAADNPQLQQYLKQQGK